LSSYAILRDDFWEVKFQEESHRKSRLEMIRLTGDGGVRGFHGSDWVVRARLRCARVPGQVYVQWLATELEEPHREE